MAERKKEITQEQKEMFARLGLPEEVKDITVTVEQVKEIIKQMPIKIADSQAAKRHSTEPEAENAFQLRHDF